MSKHAKFLRRMRQNPRSIRFDELCNLLLKLGFKMRQAGSHATFTYPGCPKILTIPEKKPSVASYYVNKTLDLLDELGLSETETEDQNEDTETDKG
jgi:predicted RNA binding protein YcfA (HicA-like mRNA interferase family)